MSENPIPPGPSSDIPPGGSGDMPPQPSGEQPPKDARTWAMIAHLAALAGYAIPFGHIIGPLIVWLIKKDEYPFVDEQGKEALNFQITVTIAVVICILLVFVCIGIPLLILVGFADLILIILATVKANDGVSYRYPFTLRLIK